MILSGEEPAQQRSKGLEKKDIEIESGFKNSGYGLSWFQRRTTD